MGDDLAWGDDLFRDTGARKIADSGHPDQPNLYELAKSGSTSAGEPHTFYTSLSYILGYCAYLNSGWRHKGSKHARDPNPRLHMQQRNKNPYKIVDFGSSKTLETAGLCDFPQNWAILRIAIRKLKSPKLCGKLCEHVWEMATCKTQTRTQWTPKIKERDDCHVSQLPTSCSMSRDHK